MATSCSARPCRSLRQSGAGNTPVQVFVKNTTTQPSFLQPFTHPDKDVDVSGQLNSWGFVELGMTQVSPAIPHGCLSQAFA